MWKRQGKLHGRITRQEEHPMTWCKLDEILKLDEKGRLGKNLTKYMLRCMPIKHLAVGRLLKVRARDLEHQTHLRAQICRGVANL